MNIESIQLHENPNAPEGANGVYLYNTAFAENLTIGQLMAAVCLRAGAVLERQSVNKMNVITKNDDTLNALSDYLENIANNTLSNWAAAKTDLVNNHGLDAAGLPDNLNSFDKRMQAMTVIKRELEQMSQQAQEDMIDLQTTINRRDVAYTTSTNLIRALGQTSSNLASKFTR